MTRTRIKICGVKDVQVAREAAAAGADAIGLVFVDESPRHVTLEQARHIVDALPPFVEPVALFVDPPLDKVRQISKALGLRTVQLHGNESPQFVSDLAPLRVIKAVNFDVRQISSTLKPWRTECDNLAGILFDAPRGISSAELPGGSGEQLDWNDLAKLEHAGLLTGLPPTILAGGLTPENVGEAIQIVKPYAVDVSSGVESSRGIKNIDRIRTFIEAVQLSSESLRIG